MSENKPNLIKPFNTDRWKPTGVIAQMEQHGKDWEISNKELIEKINEIINLLKQDE